MFCVRKYILFVVKSVVSSCGVVTANSNSGTADYNLQCLLIVLCAGWAGSSRGEEEVHCGTPGGQWSAGWDRWWDGTGWRMGGGLWDLSWSPLPHLGPVPGQWCGEHPGLRTRRHHVECRHSIQTPASHLCAYRTIGLVIVREHQ